MRVIESHNIDEETIKKLMSVNWGMGETVGTYKGFFAGRPFPIGCQFKDVPHLQFASYDGFVYFIYDEAFLQRGR